MQVLNPTVVGASPGHYSGLSATVFAPALGAMVAPFAERLSGWGGRELLGNTPQEDFQIAQAERINAETDAAAKQNFTAWDRENQNATHAQRIAAAQGFKLRGVDENTQPGDARLYTGLADRLQGRFTDGIIRQVADPYGERPSDAGAAPMSRPERPIGVPDLFKATPSLQDTEVPVGNVEGALPAQQSGGRAFMAMDQATKGSEQLADGSIVSTPQYRAGSERARQSAGPAPAPSQLVQDTPAMPEETATKMQEAQTFGQSTYPQGDPFATWTPDKLVQGRALVQRMGAALQTMQSIAKGTYTDASEAGLALSWGAHNDSVKKLFEMALETSGLDPGLPDGRTLGMYKSWQKLRNPDFIGKMSPPVKAMVQQQSDEFDEWARKHGSAHKMFLLDRLAAMPQYAEDNNYKSYLAGLKTYADVKGIESDAAYKTNMAKLASQEFDLKKELQQGTLTHQYLVNERLGKENMVYAETALPMAKLEIQKGYSGMYNANKLANAQVDSHAVQSLATIHGVEMAAYKQRFEYDKYIHDAGLKENLMQEALAEKTRDHLDQRLQSAQEKLQILAKGSPARADAENDVAMTRRMLNAANNRILNRTDKSVMPPKLYENLKADADQDVGKYMVRLYDGQRNDPVGRKRDIDWGDLNFYHDLTNQVYRDQNGLNQTTLPRSNDLRRLAVIVAKRAADTNAPLAKPEQFYTLPVGDKLVFDAQSPGHSYLDPKNKYDVRDRDQAYVLYKNAFNYYKAANAGVPRE